MLSLQKVQSYDNRMSIMCLSKKIWLKTKKISEPHIKEWKEEWISHIKPIFISTIPMPYTPRNIESVNIGNKSSKQYQS
jgi:hypothetical protein